MKLFEKLKWILGILLIFILIVTTNLIDKNNFTRVKDSVVSIYEDRLVAKNLIFDMNNIIHKKEIALLTKDSSFFKVANIELNAKLEFFLENFEETRVTKKENKVFTNLKKSLNNLFSLEKANTENLFSKTYSNELEEIKKTLVELSNIQLEEGRRQVSISEKALKKVELFTQIEIYLLVFLAIAIQIIVIYNPKKEEK